MTTNQKEIIFGLFDRVDAKRNKIQELTSGIMAIDNNLSSENIKIIKQKINEVIYNLASFCSDSLTLHLYQFQAKRLIASLRQYDNNKQVTVLQSIPKFKTERLVSRLDSFCVEVNAFYPIIMDIEKKKKGSKINLTINFNGVKIG